MLSVHPKQQQQQQQNKIQGEIIDYQVYRRFLLRKPSHKGLSLSIINPSPLSHSIKLETLKRL